MPVDCRYYPLFVVSCAAQSPPHHHHAPGPRVPGAGLPRQCGGCPGTVLYCTMLYCTVWWLPRVSPPTPPPGCPSPWPSPTWSHTGSPGAPGKTSPETMLPSSRMSPPHLSGHVRNTGHHTYHCTATINYIFTHRSKIENCLIER